MSDSSRSRTSDVQHPPGNRSKGQWLVIALLVASVALNIGLVGYLLGSASQSRVLPALAPPNAAIGHFLRSLPPERRAEIRPAMRTHFKLLRPSIKSHRQAHGALLQILVAEPLDVNALRAALAQLGDLDAQQRATQAGSLTDLISQLNHSERQALANTMNRPFRRHGRGGRHKPPASLTNSQE